MKHEALLQLGAELMHQFRHDEGPADVAFSNYAQHRRFLGASDRRYLANVYFHTLRNLRRFDEAIKAAFDGMVLSEDRYSTGFPVIGEMGGRAWHRRLPGEREGQQPAHRLFDRSVDTVRLGLAGIELEGDTPELVARELYRAWPKLKEKQIPQEKTLIRLMERTADLARLYSKPGKEIYNARRFSQPTWLWGLLRHGLPDEEAEALGIAMNKEPWPVLRVNLLKTTVPAAIKSLEEKRIRFEQSPLVPEAIRLRKRLPNYELPNWDQGWWEVQDDGSQLVAYYAEPEEGMRIADACAGAGGKSLALATLIKNRGTIYALDIDNNRLAPIEKRAERAGITCIDSSISLKEDGQVPLVRELDGLDMVVVDAPCSGTGTMRRNPETRWRLSPNGLEDFREKQRSILEDWALRVKPGGYLVYITCSLLEAENSAQAAWFQEKFPRFEPAPPEDFPVPLAPDGSLRLRPDSHGCDGFFAMRWRRKIEE